MSTREFDQRVSEGTPEGISIRERLRAESGPVYEAGSKVFGRPAGGVGARRSRLVHVRRIPGAHRARPPHAGPELGASRRPHLRAVRRGDRDSDRLLDGRSRDSAPLPFPQLHRLALLLHRSPRGGAPVLWRVRRLLACDAGRVAAWRRDYGLDRLLALGPARRPLRAPWVAVSRRTAADTPLASLRVDGRRGGRGGGRRGRLLTGTGPGTRCHP